ncbi:hypothetical protein BC936DRAFT_139296, partial [Jimgerdemannia flammicorona]
ISSEHYHLLHIIIAFGFIIYFLSILVLSLITNSSSFLYMIDEDSIDSKDILSELLLIRGQLIEENHEFCRMEGEYILNKVEGKTTESVLVSNYNLQDNSSTYSLKLWALEVNTRANITKELIIWELERYPFRERKEEKIETKVETEILPTSLKVNSGKRKEMS